MKYRIFSSSEKAWEGMLAAIHGANKSIYLEMYILDDDARGREFFDALEAAAKRGVRTIVILDVVGSYNFLSDAVGRIRAAGGEVLFCSFFFSRLHRKVLIIDEKVAFIGGVNVGAKYATWRDLQAQVQGPVVESVVRSFARVYRKLGGKSQFVEAVIPENPLRRASLWFVDHGIGRRRHLFRKYYIERLDRARESIVFVTPYLFPPRWFIAHIHQAILRGVRVEILLPEATDYFFVNGINRSYAASLASSGATILQTPGMNHSKAMLVDGKEGIIGSQNLDLLSFNFNIEGGIFFHDPEMVKDLSEIIAGWRAEGVAFEKSKAQSDRGGKLRWYDYPMAFFLRLFGFVPLQ
ncbi:MAG TPA: phosphatidylserine/phosphatidylglycerophosphate/cardiolipin synthase family protein [Candidatus Paceibacterota bacterium]